MNKDDIFESARQSLINLYNDSLELNDMNPESKDKEHAEECIDNDFNNVVDYINLLRLKGKIT